MDVIGLKSAQVHFCPIALVFTTAACNVPYLDLILEYFGIVGN